MLEKPWFGWFLNYTLQRPMARLDSAAFRLDKRKK